MNLKGYLGFAGCFAAWSFVLYMFWFVIPAPALTPIFLFVLAGVVITAFLCALVMRELIARYGETDIMPPEATPLLADLPELPEPMIPEDEPDEPSEQRTPEEIDSLMAELDRISESLNRAPRPRYVDPYLPPPAPAVVPVAAKAKPKRTPATSVAATPPPKHARVQNLTHLGAIPPPPMTPRQRALAAFQRKLPGQRKP